MSNNRFNKLYLRKLCNVDFKTIDMEIITVHTKKKENQTVMDVDFLNP